ncbi:thioredoxin fold domain-containing protein [uncultured Vibrio sp.]|uniref:thioredoxin fold domain-containing protein n=1 Tax=uncultured Vibrio sp. TaxID=114054 RepID=UPI00091F1D7E|nr:thioredoxin fold domain-containing protein [uncultured Vibrio sp.]OIQ24262.1 MAG: thiol:disulfide interchange protein [Vibrio sp. MedPE-SWchi]
MSVLRRLSILLLPFFIVACNAEETETVAEVESVQSESPDLKETTALSDASRQQIAHNFAKLKLTVLDISPTGIDGLYEVQTSGGVLYSSVDGEFFMSGTLYRHNEGGGYEDVLAKRQAPMNAERIASMSDEVIEYKADDEKYVVTIFTDITCGYCVRLHNQMNDYNDLGITVRYMAYPRKGPQSDVGEQMAAIWCAADPQDAMHQAKINRKLPEAGENIAQCLETVMKDYTLGQSLGISGTPSIFLPSGEMIGGYLPPERLLEQLQTL